MQEIMLIAFRFFCDSELCRTSCVLNNIYYWLLGVPFLSNEDVLSM